MTLTLEQEVAGPGFAFLENFIGEGNMQFLLDIQSQNNFTSVQETISWILSLVPTTNHQRQEVVALDYNPQAVVKKEVYEHDIQQIAELRHEYHQEEPAERNLTQAVENSYSDDPLPESFKQSCVQTTSNHATLPQMHDTNNKLYEEVLGDTTSKRNHEKVENGLESHVFKENMNFNSHAPSKCDAGTSGKLYNNTSTLDQQPSGMLGNFVCEMCPRTFKQKCGLVRHINGHLHVQTPFTCNVCQKQFRRKHHLKSHEILHTGLRPFPCDICGRTFRASTNALQHKQAVHFGMKRGRKKVERARTLEPEKVQFI